MAEHEVMWIGRRPAAMTPVEHAASTEAFAEAVTGACAGCGCEVEDYIAAAGAYGSWLVRFGRDGRRQRLVWNGKDGRLVLEESDDGPGLERTRRQPGQRARPGALRRGDSRPAGRRGPCHANLNPRLPDRAPATSTARTAITITMAMAR